VDSLLLILKLKYFILSGLSRVLTVIIIIIYYYNELFYLIEEVNGDFGYLLNIR